MEAALAEIALDDLGNDAEDDVDFITGKGRPTDPLCTVN